MLINDRLEILILKSLFYKEDFTRKVLPYIKPEYFEDDAEKKIFVEVSKFINSYGTIPTPEAIMIASTKDNKISEQEIVKVKEKLESLSPQGMENLDDAYLLKNTEEWAKNSAIYGAVYRAANILGDVKKPKAQILELINDALAVSFDSDIGHNYILNAEDRYAFYHSKEEKLKFDLKYFNAITKDGIARKTLNVILAGTGVGKSLVMCHFASSYLLEGKNVLYITLEMSEEKIAERIDSNLMDVPISDIESLPKDSFFKKIDKIRQKTAGKLIIKEYPTSSASTTHFRALLQELKLKKSFVPDIILIDYINLATSARIGAVGQNVNSYTYIKSIAEEIRGMAVEYDVPVWTATQLNRAGFTSSDVGLENTSESFGLPATADLMFALVSSEVLEKKGQLMVKQLKNRYHDVNFRKKWLIGVNKSKMRLFDLDDKAQEGLVDTGVAGTVNPSGRGFNPAEVDQEDDDIPSFDKTDFGRGDKASRFTSFKYE